MNTLIDFLGDNFSIAYIEENDAVMDETFMITPITTESFKGNGQPQSIVDYYAVEIFFKDKSLAVSSGKIIWKELLKNKYFCDDPQYTFEKEAEFWRVTLRVRQIVEV